jgi:GTPase
MEPIRQECTIAVCGPVDAGKSSLIGVLTSGEFDDGRGLARNKILVHPHERESGRTSHISYNPLVYNRKDDSTINLFNLKDNKQSMEIRTRTTNKWSTKVTSFIDLAGHEKYLKTTIFGVTGMFPDYGIVVIGANTGITKLTKEHIGILLYLNIPFIITITKIDMAPKDVYQNLCNQLKKLLGKATFKKILYFINNEKETDDYVDKMLGNPDIIPIISISNKTGVNINNLHQILYHLPKREKWDAIQGSIFYIDATFQVPGIGLVVSGTNKGKEIGIRQKMYLGPFTGINKDDETDGKVEFKEVVVRSIHNSLSENVEVAGSSLQSTLAIKLTNSKEILDRKQIRKGMVLIDNIDKFKDYVTRKFKAKINILHHTTTIKSGYAPVIHCGPIRQSASLTLNNQILRNGDTCEVEFEFKYYPEFLEKNMVFFFRDGTTKGVGTVKCLS